MIFKVIAEDPYKSAQYAANIMNTSLLNIILNCCLKDNDDEYDQYNMAPSLFSKMVFHYTDYKFNSGIKCLHPDFCLSEI
jgi:hypothetical protein